MKINLNDLENYKDLHPRFEDMEFVEVFETLHSELERGEFCEF